MLELKDDKLNRKPFLDSLFNIFNNFSDQGNKGLTILINGKYGSGKTTTLGFIKENNAKLDTYSVIEYNAWENNLFENPLIPILNEINQLNSNKNKLKDTALKLIKKLPKIIFSTLANVHGVDLTPATENKDVFKEFKEYKNLLNNYRNILAEFCKSKKVLILVDELDRCLPEYQIKVLETIYHLLNIPNLIVVIALDREQLECSIKGYFGEEKNTFGYLSKFIDYQIDLPDDDNLNFICSLMKFECVGAYTDYVKRLIAKMFDLVGFSIRECQHLAEEINLICNRVDRDGNTNPVYYWYPLFVSFILISKYKSNEIYKKWFYKDKKENYMTTKIALQDSVFYQFVEDIQNTEIKLIVDYLKCPDDDHSGIPESFLMNLIHAFTPIKLIKEEDLAKFTCFNLDEISKFRMETQYPYTINSVINQVKMFNFK